jgi:hypothetical protein
MFGQELDGSGLAGLAHATAFQLNKAVVGDVGDALVNAVKGSANAALDEAARFAKAHTEDPIDFSLPFAESELGEERPSLETALEVVDAEVGGVGVGNVDGDERDVSLLEDVRDARGDCFLHLELEDKVDTARDEFRGIPDSNIGVVAVVEDEEFDAGGGSGGCDGVGYGDGEGHVSALDGEPETETAGAGDEAVAAVLRLGDVAAMDEGLENTVDAGLGDASLLVDVFE